MRKINIRIPLYFMSIGVRYEISEPLHFEIKEYIMWRIVTILESIVYIIEY